MSTSDKVKALLALRGERQNDLAAAFGMSKQTMSNKMARDSWSAKDLIKVADFLGGRVAVILGDGQTVFLDADVGSETGPDE